MRHRERFIFVFFLLLTPLLSPARSQRFKGWPGHDGITDLESAFADPPKGYGNVPFYWWTGDPLDLERLNGQLEILSDASTDGFCVSYNHTHADVDVELNAAGHGPCGRVSGGQPRVMSEDWWKIWNAFSASCAEKGIGLGMDDYVIAWPKNGEFIDSILNEPSIRAYRGLLVKERVARTDGRPSDALVELCSDADSVTYICTAPAPWLHPDFGREIVDKYFRQFEEHMDDAGRKGMNYFFQDELQYDLRLQSWCEDMPGQFLARKGYDIVPLLPALFIDRAEDVDAEAARVRLDYAEVLTQLAEERYFKPTYEWNASRGLIYGCDPEGRGLRPLRYLDYFRAISWFTAPGNDAPSRGSSFRQTKVSSSIAHLYGRPRTWLEAFHSMDWDANGALLKRQLDHHLIAGGNLLCMHGLYYSTHGGWWEWAPPCFHFRMPYWPHMKLWLRYAERMCFLLSQGTHVCDVAIMYPTETMQAYPGTDAKSTFAVSDLLSLHGIDYDFIDYQSLQKAGAGGGSLNVSGESYRVLVLADTRAMHEETLAKVLGFMSSGGAVVALGDVMPEIRGAGALVLDSADALPDAVSGLVDRDFRTSGGTGKVLHRRIGEKDVYMVMDVSRGDMMHFRAKGKASVWDAMSGECRSLAVSSVDEDGSWVRYDGDSDGSMLVVFSPGEPELQGCESACRTVSEQRVGGDWDITVIPTMDNRWGDFRLPAGDGFIGVEAREFRYSCPGISGEIASFNGYGPYMMTCTVDASDVDSLLCALPADRAWEPYVWSWQYGVKDSPGNQGWHGLKSKVDSRFIILDRGGCQLFRTCVNVPRKGLYRLCIEGRTPDRALLDGQAVPAGEIRLDKGWHSLLLVYAGTVKSDYQLRGMRGGGLDRRGRSMVVLYPADAPEPHEYSMYDSIVASKWYGTPHLEFDPFAGKGKWEFSFDTAPGTCSVSFPVNGKVRKVSVGGRSVRFSRRNGMCTLEMKPVSSGVSTVVVEAAPADGFPGAAFFGGPAVMECRGGRMPEGDWTDFGALGFYSGAVRYEKDVEIARDGCRVVLDLGEVDATCEVSVNGSPARALIGAPYRLDITDSVHGGMNHIDVLVYSSLSNHYRTIPSAYRGTPHAGLVGPVKLVYSGNDCSHE